LVYVWTESKYNPLREAENQCPSFAQERQEEFLRYGFSGEDGKSYREGEFMKAAL